MPNVLRIFLVAIVFASWACVNHANENYSCVNGEPTKSVTLDELIDASEDIFLARANSKGQRLSPIDIYKRGLASTTFEVEFIIENILKGSPEQGRLNHNAVVLEQNGISLYSYFARQSKAVERNTTKYGSAAQIITPAGNQEIVPEVQIGYRYLFFCGAKYSTLSNYELIVHPNTDPIYDYVQSTIQVTSVD